MHKINHQDDEGNTPLHILLTKSKNIRYNLPAIAQLIECEASIFNGNEEEETEFDMMLSDSIIFPFIRSHICFDFLIGGSDVLVSIFKNTNMDKLLKQEQISSNDLDFEIMVKDLQNKLFDIVSIHLILNPNVYLFFTDRNNYETIFNFFSEDIVTYQEIAKKLGKKVIILMLLLRKEGAMKNFPLDMSLYIAKLIVTPEIFFLIRSIGT